MYVCTDIYIYNIHIIYIYIYINVRSPPSGLHLFWLSSTPFNVATASTNENFLDRNGGSFDREDPRCRSKIVEHCFGTLLDPTRCPMQIWGSKIAPREYLAISDLGPSPARCHIRKTPHRLKPAPHTETLSSDEYPSRALEREFLCEAWKGAFFTFLYIKRKYIYKFVYIYIYERT